MTYWPNTDIPKSTRNAFNWRTGISEVTSDRKFKQSVAGTHGASMQKSRSFTVYSKAKASK